MELEVTQGNINQLFRTDVVMKSEILFTTCDGRVFIDRSEATLHAEGKLDGDTGPLPDKTIATWLNPH